MSVLELSLIGIGLSMDAFAVAISQGLKMEKIKKINALTIALFFGVFQAVMPLIGWLIGRQFENYIAKFDHWIAFFVLLVIGAKMIKDSFSKNQNGAFKTASLNYKELTLLALATSIDALAVGISFAFLNTKIFPAIILIGAITLVLSFFGVFVGNFFGSKYKNKAEFAGGVILILIGTKILFEHLGIIHF